MTTPIDDGDTNKVPMTNSNGNAEASKAPEPAG